MGTTKVSAQTQESASDAVRATRVNVREPTRMFPAGTVVRPTLATVEVAYPTSGRCEGYDSKKEEMNLGIKTRGTQESTSNLSPRMHGVGW